MPHTDPQDSPVARLRPLFESPVPAIALRVAARPRWRQVLSPARLLLACALVPLLMTAYADQLGGGDSLTWGWRVGLLPVALPAALTLATYLPQRGAAVAGSPCAAAAGLTVLFAGMALGGAPPQVATLLLASGLASYGLRQRLRGAAACGPRARY